MYEIMQEKAENILFLSNFYMLLCCLSEKRKTKTIRYRCVLLVQFGKDPDHVPLAVHCLTDDPESMYPSMHE